ncbi:MAG: hypothetical protein ACKPKO_16670, partial [Candidatus Fonsibacter sp.]
YPHWTRVAVVLLCMLAVYVDDFKLVRPTKSISSGWELLRKGLHIEPEQGVDSKGAVYFGCKHIVSTIKLPSGVVATTMIHDMEGFLKS